MKRDPATRPRPKRDPDAPKMSVCDRDPASPSIDAVAGRGSLGRIKPDQTREVRPATPTPYGGFGEPTDLDEDRLLELAASRGLTVYAAGPDGCLVPVVRPDRTKDKPGSTRRSLAAGSKPGGSRGEHLDTPTKGRSTRP